MGLNPASSRDYLGDASTDLDDVAIERLYNELVGDRVPTKQPAKAPTKKKPAFVGRPGTAVASVKKAPAMTITEVGKKAKSRLFDYKDSHDELRQKNLHQLKKEAIEKKSAI